MIINREISWLSFNERVLQEAEDEINPLIERMRFLGIFSNNLDEFFRVRVASVRRLIKLQRKTGIELDESPQWIMNHIHENVIRLQKRFDATYSKIIKQLENQGIFIINESQLSETQTQFVKEYFLQKVEPLLVPIMVRKIPKFPYLNDDANYLFVGFRNKSGSKTEQYSLIEIPRNISRFAVLPDDRGKKYIIYLDDIIRANLPRIFSIFDCEQFDAHVFKITRDAELDLDDDIVVGLYDKIRRSLEKRKKGEPLRFIYDSTMPQDRVKFLLKKMNLAQEENIIPGGRYHNFKDFMKFPNVGGEDLVFKKRPSLANAALENVTSTLKTICKKDILLHYPYQSFDYVIDMLREAAIMPSVKSIRITLYRVAKDSRVINALINAVKNGKEVIVVIELQARFDEEANLHWAKALTDGGARIILGSPGLKIHSKLILINFKHEGQERKVAHIGTGNFHEGTANVYSDISLLTANENLTTEVERVFQFIEKPYLALRFEHLLVSPRYTRNSLIELIKGQIQRQKSGKTGYVLIKLNNLVDKDLITKLYEAADLGVKIDLIVRGICSLVPDHKNINAISILDKYLEHARIFVFGKGKNRKVFISSADWMTRNLDYRIEVTTPIYESKLQDQIIEFLRIQLSDNVKARNFDKSMKNEYVRNDSKAIRSQIEFYNYLSELKDIETA
ncbi:MAG: polyphosphate kinase 1 [Bacteroidia bacterium]